VLTDRVYGGTYQVNPDGTGVFTIDLPGASFSSGFTIIEDGQTIEVLHRRSDVVATFSLRK